ncbi:unnamed protein product [Urochloa humidicola]
MSPPPALSREAAAGPIRNPSTAAWPLPLMRSSTIQSVCENQMRRIGGTHARTGTVQFGMTESAYFIGRYDILAWMWINATLQLGVFKVEEKWRVLLKGEEGAIVREKIKQARSWCETFLEKLNQRAKGDDFI